MRLGSERTAEDIAKTAAAAAAAAAGEMGFPDIGLLRRSKYDGEIAAIALPAFAASVTVPLSSVVDAAIVGRLGNAQLAGVGMSVVLFFVLQTVFSFLSILATPATAKAAAKGDMEEVSRTASKNIWLAAVSGVFISATLFFGADKILSLLNPAASVKTYAAIYLKTMSFLGPAALSYFSLSGIFRGLKDTKSIFFSVLLASVTNLSLDCLFVFGFGWGVTGAGIATVVSVWSSFLFLIGLLIKRKQLLLKHLWCPPPIGSIISMVKTGVPLSIQAVLSAGTIFFASVSVSHLGTTIHASYEVLRQIFGLCFCSYIPLGVAAQTLCASYLGEGRPDDAWNVFQRLLQAALIISSVFGFGALLNAANVAKIFTPDPVLIREVVKVMPFVIGSLPLDSAASIMDGALIAAEQTSYTSVASIITSTLAIVLMLGLSATGSLTLFATWACIKFGIASRGLFTFYRLYHTNNHPYLREKSEPTAVMSPS